MRAWASYPSEFVDVPGLPVFRSVMNLFLPNLMPGSLSESKYLFICRFD